MFGIKKKMPGTGSYIFARLAFYPSLFYNYVMCHVSNRNWYDRIDETVLLGALPFRGIAKELVTKENVRAVLSANQPHELSYFTPTDEEWKSLGVDCLRLKILDFLGTPSPTQLDEALSFIENHRKQGHNVYVHCKAGRTRSATLVACYLIKTYKWDHTTAWNHLTSKRPHARLFQPQKDFIRDFHLNQLRAEAG